MRFLSFSISEKLINSAKAIREKRDAQYGNIFLEFETDLRWVGDLGEICFNWWLKQNQINQFHWHLDNAAGKPDFTVNGKRIDVKTVKRKVPPQPHYTAQITGRHKDSSIQELFFCSYEYQINRMWFLGGISKVKFLESAIYYKAGDQVHSNYSIREGHEIYNTKIEFLTEPNRWIEELIK